MPKVNGIEGNDDEDDVERRILEVALTATIFKEDIRIIITESSAKPSPKKGGFKVATP